MSRLEPRPGVSERAANKLIAHLAGVQTALDRNVRRMEGPARALLARHTKSGEHEIRVTRGKADRFLELTGPAATALEKGHVDARSGRHVEGIHVLEQAARSQVVG